MENIENLKPFPKFCYTIGMIPTSFRVSLTYEEQVLEIMRYLKDEVVPKVNINALATKELQEKFVELKNYVDNYFEDLDLQTEINAKLDEMAESGELGEIITEYLTPEIENLKPYFNVKLQPYFYFDDATQNYNFQSATIDENNILYTYNQNNYPYGDILKFDASSKSYIGKLTSLKLYHANDMCVLNNKLYVASCQGETQLLKNRAIVIYDLINNTISEINPFDNYTELTPYVSLIGISIIDNDNLLCALTKGGETFAELLFTKYNITSGEVTIMTIANPNHLKTDYYYFYQSCEYLNGNIYMMTSSVNSLMKFKVKDNVASLDYIFSLPNYDNNGVSVGETEGLAKFPSETYGKDTLLITSQAVNNKMFPNLSLRGGLVNVVSNLPTYPTSRPVNPYVEDIINVYVDNTSSSLYEDGTEAHPFKDLGRAIECVNNNKNFNFRDIRIAGGDNYRLGRMINETIAIDTYGRTINIVGDVDFRGCKVSIVSDSTGGFVFKGSNISIDNSDCTFIRCTFEGKISSNYGCYVRFNDCTLSGSTDRAMVLRKTQCYLGITYTGSLSKPINYLDFSTIFLPNANLRGLLEQTGATSLVFSPE